MVLLTITSGTDPCNILSKGASGVLKDETFTAMTSNGILKTFIDTYGNSITSTSQPNNVLATGLSDTSSTLVKYLNGTIDRKSNKKLIDICLGTTTTSGIAPNEVKTLTTESIVDTYIISTVRANVASNYTYTYEGGPGNFAILTDAQILSIRNAILNSTTSNNLLKESELYNVDELKPTGSPTAGQETLLYLYKLSASELTTSQLDRMKSLETKNLRFFSAFFVEYCLYRKRYNTLLDEYFNYFTQSSYSAPAAGSEIYKLFEGNISTATQPALLERIAYHMACLKTRMNDMIRILNSINQYYSEIFAKIQASINDGSLPGSSEQLKNSIMVLNASTNDSKKYLTEAQFRQGVMEYTQEKNRNANILLGLYAFLNITALAIIFRVASS